MLPSGVSVGDSVRRTTDSLQVLTKVGKEVAKQDVRWRPVVEMSWSSQVIIGSGRTFGVPLGPREYEEFIHRNRAFFVEN